MARLFIPQVGNQLKLISNWNCKVFNEHRNSKVFSALNIDTTSHSSIDTNIDITFPKGTVLKVDRLYVRAPASSYDSITFSVVSSPIKSLNKTRFWVKILDANNIEFEEKIINIDSHKKLKDLHRFIALKNSYQNSENLLPEEESLVNKEIYDHFAKKNNNVLNLKFDISAEDLAQTITFDHHRGYYTQAHTNKIYNEALEFIRNKLDKIEVELQMIPVLDGWVIHFEENQQAIEIDKALDIYNKEDSNYWRTFRLGSYLSYGDYQHFLDKKEIPELLANKIDSDKLNEIIFSYQGKQIDFKDATALEKFLKSIRIKIEK